jgi:uncharacterized membrane protein HdeD (DUF308 family)
LIEKRSPGWLRVLEILAGVLVLAVAFFVLADSSFALTVLAYTLGIGLFILGLSRILASIYGRYFAPWFREINAGGGIIALVLGTVVIIDPQLAIGFLTLLVAFALLVVGIVEIVAAGFAKHPPVWVRGLIGIVGVLTVILSVFVIFDSSLGQLSLAFIMAIVLVAVGVRDIAHGVSGHRPVKIDPGIVTKV